MLGNVMKGIRYRICFAWDGKLLLVYSGFLIGAPIIMVMWLYSQKHSSSCFSFFSLFFH